MADSIVTSDNLGTQRLAFRRGLLRQEVTLSRTRRLAETEQFDPESMTDEALMRELGGARKAEPDKTPMHPLIYAEPKAFEQSMQMLLELRAGTHTRRFQAPFPWSLLDERAHADMQKFLLQQGIARPIPCTNWTSYPADWSITPQTPNVATLLPLLARLPITLMMLQSSEWHEFFQSQGLQYLEAAGVTQHDIMRLLSYVGRTPEPPREENKEQP
jgi:hypothetical protein